MIPRNMVAQRVTVAGNQKDFTGLLYPGVKPPHIQTEADRNKKLDVSDFVVDLYMSSRRGQRRNRNRRNGNTTTRLRRNWQWRKL